MWCHGVGGVGAFYPMFVTVDNDGTSQTSVCMQITCMFMKMQNLIQ